MSDQNCACGGRFSDYAKLDDSYCELGVTPPTDEIAYRPVYQAWSKCVIAYYTVVIHPTARRFQWALPLKVVCSYVAQYITIIMNYNFFHVRVTFVTVNLTPELLSQGVISSFSLCATKFCIFYFRFGIPLKVRNVCCRAVFSMLRTHLPI